MKRSEFRAHPSLVNFQFPGPLARPAISIVPDLYSRALRSIDRFFIFASHGFWQHLKNPEAAEIVRNNPRRVCILLLFFFFPSLFSPFIFALACEKTRFLFLIVCCAFLTQGNCKKTSEGCSNGGSYESRYQLYGPLSR